jgi:hypothetical protein
MSLVHYVSPRYTADKLASRSIEDRIDVYEDRVQGWFIAPTRSLLDIPHAEFAVLNLCLGYFEGWAQYYSGEDSTRRSAEFFCRGLSAVFPFFDFGDVVRKPGDERRIFDVLYEQARCGVAHDGMPRKKVLIRSLPTPIAVSAQIETGEIGAIFVDSRQFLEHIERHFPGYVTALRDPANIELRENFTRTWERVSSGSPILIPGSMPTQQQL